MTTPTAFTRAAFEAQRAEARKAERQGSRLLAVVSVLLGVAQLLFLRWADLHLERSPKLILAGVAFLAYAFLVSWLLGRMVCRRGAARPRCPQCGIRLGDESARIAAATGRCDACGGQVIE